jgi:hypothetical protein
MDNINEQIVREHITRMNELNSPARQQIQEISPDLLDIVQSLKKKPELIIKVKMFIASFPEIELKPNSDSQVMS